MGLCISHGIGIPFQKSSQSWSQYWATRTPSNLVLTVISDTEIDGTFTINGTGQDGHKVYVSTDNVTFSLLETLIGADNSFSATGLVPYTIYYFYVTGYKGLNESGHCPIEYVRNNYPAILDDGHSVDWWKHDRLDKITKDGSDVLSEWISLLTAKKFVKPAASGDPTWTYDGVLFDGTNDRHRVALTLNQPCTIYYLLNQVTWSASDCLADGFSVAKGLIQQMTASPEIMAHAGSSSSNNSNLPVNTLGVLMLLLNGANSKFQIDNTPAITGNFGAGNPAGLTIGGPGFGVDDYFSNVKYREIISRKIADSDANSLLIRNYLIKRKNLFTIQSSGNFRFYIPEVFSENSKVILYCHGRGEVANTIIGYDTRKFQTMYKFLEQGFGVISTLADGDNYGNQDGIDDYNALIAWAKTIYNFSDISIWAMSMGGLSGLQLFIQDTQFDKFIGIYPMCNLGYSFTITSPLNFKSEIKTAYGFSNDADYSASTAGHDPMLLSSSLLNNRKMLFVASEADTYVNKDNNTDAFITAFSGYADITLETATGNHGDVSHFDADRDIAFLRS